MAAATAPAIPPERQWLNGSYLRVGLRTLARLSYAVNWIAVNGIVMAKVVG